MAQPAASEPSAGPSDEPGIVGPLPGLLPKVPPHKLDFSIDRGESFRAWKVRWDDYALLAGLSAQPPPVRMAVLRSCLSDEAIRVVNNFDLPAAQRNDMAAVLKRLEEYACGQSNQVLQRRLFNLRSQREGEAFDDFLTELRELSNTCGFCDKCRESLIRDRVVIGLRDPDVIKKLCAVRNLTLDQAVQLCRSEEAASRDAGEIVGTDVAACRAPARGRSRDRQDGRRGDSAAGRTQHGGRQVAGPGRQVSSPCQQCGRVHRRPDRCPARGRECHECGVMGHFAAMCPTRAAPSRHMEPAASEVSVSSATHASAPRVLVEVRAHLSAKMEALPTRGADV